jgi:hypothetical protein
MVRAAPTFVPLVMVSETVPSGAPDVSLSRYVTVAGVMELMTLPIPAIEYPVPWNTEPPTGVASIPKSVNVPLVGQPLLPHVRSVPDMANWPELVPVMTNAPAPNTPMLMFTVIVPITELAPALSE